MKCQTLDQLCTEVYSLICRRVGNNKYVVVRRIEDVSCEGTTEPNGKMMEFFDSPTAAVSWAKRNFALAYQGKKLVEESPTTGIPLEFGGRRDPARLIVRIISDADGHIDRVKYVIYQMTPEDIAKFLSMSGMGVGVFNDLISPP